MKTVRDIRKIEKEHNVRVFGSTQNSRGRILVTIVKGKEARNKNEGEVIYQEEFRNWNQISEKAYKKALAAVESSNN